MKITNLMTLILVAIATFNTSVANAKLVQILHTNDTHSYLDNSTHSSVRGGAARLKTLINSYKDKMAEEGVQTLVFNAGDFLEGNIYFMAKDGRKSFEVHNEMGYDFGTLGNHDYQMGADELDKLLGEIDLKFNILVANLSADKKYKNLKNKVSPYKEITVDGFKLAIMGLTTDEMLYKWRLTKGAISDPIDTAKELEQKLVDRGNDYIIALTHIGVLQDIKLAEKTKYIDLIIGGHSHTELFKPTFVINKQKNVVPIVQAGQHTEYLGRLVVDLQKNKPLKVVSYELVPVIVDNPDEEIKQMVEQTDAELDVTYGKEWLNEKIGYSDLKADDPKGTRKWAYFITDTMKARAGADIAIHTPEMNGANFPVGDITRRVIVNSIPRIFDVSQKYGWDIYTTKITGVWLRVFLSALSYVGEPLTFSGLSMEYERGPMGFKVRNILVNGKKVNPMKTYTVAFTEGIIKGASGINPKTVAILRNPKNTNYKIWATLEERIRNSKEPISKLCEEDHTTLWPKK